MNTTTTRPAPLDLARYDGHVMYSLATWDDGDQEPLERPCIEMDAGPGSQEGRATLCLLADAPALLAELRRCREALQQAYAALDYDQPGETDAPLQATIRALLHPDQAETPR